MVWSGWRCRVTNSLFIDPVAFVHERVDEVLELARDVGDGNSSVGQLRPRQSSQPCELALIGMLECVLRRVSVYVSGVICCERNQP